MILRALLPPVRAGGARGAVEAAGDAGVLALAVTADPHLLQNFGPGFRAAPQELQNAINHLEASGKDRRREYIAHYRWEAVRFGLRRLSPCRIISLFLFFSLLLLDNPNQLQGRVP
jgi:hypothetical protein